MILLVIFFPSIFLIANAPWELNQETRNILPPKEELGIEEEIIVDAWATTPPKENNIQSENQNKKNKSE